MADIYGTRAMSVIRRRLVAHGQVQGVFFRDSVRRAAATRGVSGWASNRPDGCVEVVFEGDAEAVHSMLEAVRRGPGRSTVERLEVFEEDPQGLSGFDVR